MIIPNSVDPYQTLESLTSQPGQDENNGLMLIHRDSIWVDTPVLYKAIGHISHCDLQKLGFFFSLHLPWKKSATNKKPIHMDRFLICSGFF